ncbi:hypothetical protein GCM10010124_31650 [Pilimelia terevasa]|uniref:Uncharacterized protein n=1 Tax=Pilimelia terevasa TaxID=53372 RepID=A0A8J3FL17_9ACTN|nr:hypothetical protein [Pilimelia terevasa]GGK36681.1 hypothetical protein GCM10010124_31650 [Pilimelia terevasa]
MSNQVAGAPMVRYRYNVQQMRRFAVIASRAADEWELVCDLLWAIYTPLLSHSTVPTPPQATETGEVPRLLIPAGQAAAIRQLAYDRADDWASRVEVALRLVNQMPPEYPDPGQPTGKRASGPRR